jgi:transcriptional regulator with XRE-family HTH domain
MSEENTSGLAGRTNEELVAAVCHALRDMRKKQGISQEELSRRSGVDRVTISRTEKGRPASLLTVIQLLRGLGQLDLLNTIIITDNITPISSPTNPVTEKSEPPKGEYPDW